MTTNTEKTQTVQTVQPAGISLRSLLWVTPLAIALSSIANIGLYLIAGAIFPEVTAWPGASIGRIVGANIVYLLIGIIVFAITARFSSRPARHYLVIATIGLLFSLILPISTGFGYSAPGVPPADAATVVTLSLMHVVSYAISVPLYIRYGLE